jgi:hypothetical protein
MVYTEISGVKPFKNFTPFLQFNIVHKTLNPMTELIRLPVLGVLTPGGRLKLYSTCDYNVPNERVVVRSRPLKMAISVVLNP